MLAKTHCCKCYKHLRQVQLFVLLLFTNKLVNKFTAFTAIVISHAFDITRKYPEARNFPLNWWITSFRVEFWSLTWHKLSFHGETSSTAPLCKFAFKVGFSMLRTFSSFLGHWHLQLSLLPLLFHNSVSQVGDSFGAVIYFIIMYFSFQARTYIHLGEGKTCPNLNKGI